MLDHERPLDKLFKCDKCSYQNNRKAKLVEHTRQVHDRVMAHHCIVEGCGMSFTRPDKLRIHNTKKHS